MAHLVSKGVVERDGVDHILVALQRVDLLSAHRVPDLLSTIGLGGASRSRFYAGDCSFAPQGPRRERDSEPIGQGESAPHLARSVVGARDELVAALVERAVGERQDVRAEHLCVRGRRSIERECSLGEGVLMSCHLLF